MTRSTALRILHVSGAALAVACAAVFPLSASRIAEAHAANRISASAHAPRIVTKFAASLGPLHTIVQTLNNCGPASVAEVLGYWHVYRTQAQVAAVLRADNASWGMSPMGVPVYARSVDLRGLVAYGGTERLVKLLVANGFPVIVSQYVSLADPIRHYRPIQAYDDRTRTFVSADPYLGAGHTISYDEFNSIWAVSHGRFLVVYPSSRQTMLDAVLRAGGWNRARTYSDAIRWAQARMRKSSVNVPGSWIHVNGYVDIAFSQAQLGQFRKADGSLAVAARQGASPILIGFVRDEIRWLRTHA